MASELTASPTPQTSAPAPRAPHFEVLDRGESRQDLARRTEVKYLVPGADIDKLRALLAGRCEQQIHHLPVSHVHSVYFDDARMSACYANLNGNGLRRKVRLRWYDTLSAPDHFFFEVKWRNNRVTGKHRLEMRAPQPLHEMSFAKIRDGLTDALPEELLPDLLRYHDPVVIVQYRRQHFVSLDQQLRLTLDYDIQFFDQRGKRQLSTQFSRKLENLVVIEGKTQVGEEYRLRRILHPFQPRAGRCSKYVHGCQLLGHVRADL